VDRGGARHRRRCCYRWLLWHYEVRATTRGTFFAALTIMRWAGPGSWVLAGTFHQGRAVRRTNKFTAVSSWAAAVAATRGELIVGHLTIAGASRSRFEQRPLPGPDVSVLSGGSSISSTAPSFRCCPSTSFVNTKGGRDVASAVSSATAAEADLRPTALA